MRSERTYLRPDTLEEALAFLQDHVSETRILAGGTDIFPVLRAGALAPGCLLDLSFLPELEDISEEGDGLFIGAGVRIADVLSSSLVARHAPILQKAARFFGSPQVRNMATVGGNICRASPAGDTLPSLYVLNARVELVAPGSSRRLPIRDFVLGPGQTALEKGELLRGVWVPDSSDLPLQCFEKVGNRRALFVSAVSLAALVRLSPARTLEEVRLAWGSVAPTVVRSEEVEDYLRGKPCSAETFERAFPLVQRALRPITDIRGSADYRRQVACNLLFRLLEQEPGPFPPSPASHRELHELFALEAPDLSSRNIGGPGTLRIGLVERLEGKAPFAADVPLDRPLVLRVLRSPRAHARILSMDTDKARQVEGVVRIFTARDVPGKNLTGIINKDRPLLVTDRVRCLGDAIALVAAENEEAAEEALLAIQVAFEDLPVIRGPEEALKPDAPRIHEKGNVLLTRRVKKGDVDKAFSACRVKVERTYQTPYLEHTYLEPDAGAGYVDGDGTLVILASTQNPHYDHAEVTSLLALEEKQVRIVQTATGGGFGSKLDLNAQGFIGLALYYLQRPVRYVFSREESYLATAKRHPLTLRYETGADQNGKILAVRARILCDTGAYGSYGIAVATRAAVHATGPYAVENVDVESLCVYTNGPACGAMRGFGVPQAAFAHESQMDLVAEALGMDPLEIRRINGLRPGSRTATAHLLKESVGLGPCLEAIEPYYSKACQTWKKAGASPYQRRGVGVAAMYYGIGNTGIQNPSTAQVEIDLHGQVTLYTGCADIGQGSSTVLCQIAGQVLGVRSDRIRLICADTRYTTSAGATSASRQTYISGNAVKEAATRLADVLLTEAVDLLKTPREQLVLAEGFIRQRNGEKEGISLARAASRAREKGIPLKWQGFFDPPTEPLDPDTGLGIPYATYAYACHLALVTVDLLTGQVQVRQVVAAHDVGKAIYPEGVLGQIYGGVAMGAGFALMEEYVPGVTRSMQDYATPTTRDMPKVIPLLVECPEPTGPFGAKGVGEPALIPTAPAILNALSDALGTRILALPANPERVLAAAGHLKTES